MGKTPYQGMIQGVDRALVNGLLGCRQGVLTMAHMNFGCCYGLVAVIMSAWRVGVVVANNDCTMAHMECCRNFQGDSDDDIPFFMQDGFHPLKLHGDSRCLWSDCNTPQDMSYSQH